MRVHHARRGCEGCETLSQRAPPGANALPPSRRKRSPDCSAPPSGGARDRSDGVAAGRVTHTKSCGRWLSLRDPPTRHPAEATRKPDDERSLGHLRGLPTEAAQTRIWTTERACNSDSGTEAVRQHRGRAHNFSLWLEQRLVSAEKTKEPHSGIRAGHGPLDRVHLKPGGFPRMCAGDIAARLSRC